MSTEPLDRSQEAIDEAKRAAGAAADTDLVSDDLGETSPEPPAGTPGEAAADETDSTDGRSDHNRESGSERTSD